MSQNSKWLFQEKDIKRYPHFDGLASLTNLRAYATSPNLVAKHAFFPFLQYKDEWIPFGERHISRKRKSRPIRYACRRDSAIFKYYRHLLSDKYEKKLKELDISSCPIAYRKIPSENNPSRGKCNIDYASDVFKIVKSLQDCCVVTLDISSYFESIDHERLKQCWCDLLGVDRLPQDHFAVFKAVTKYSYVDRDTLYEALGFLERRRESPKRTKYIFKVPKSDVPIQLCSSNDFRELTSSDKKVIKKNKNPFGIPQGSPISDLLANMYLIEFDVKMNAYARKRNGYYFRYSDDLIFIIPGEETIGIKTQHFASNHITPFGKMLKIKKRKSAIGCFSTNLDGHLTYKHVSGNQGRNGLEYLGFRFDGEYVYIRESTLSKLHRKIKYSARSHARKLVTRYQGKDMKFLIRKFSIPKFMQRFSRVQDFDKVDSYYDWTFWTYVRRATDVFGGANSKIHKQMTNLNTFIKDTVQKELEYALKEYANKHS